MKRRVGTICSCRNEILYYQRKCPHCGAFNAKGRKKVVSIILSVVVTAVTILYMSALTQYEGADTSSILTGLLFIALAALCCYFTFADIVRMLVFSPKHCTHKYNKSCWCDKCGFADHDWDGCKCKRCLRTRDESHDWDGCKCRRCGAVRDELHDWDGCKCTRCKKTIEHEPDASGRCRRCGRVRAMVKVVKCVYLNGNRCDHPDTGYYTFNCDECHIQHDTIDTEEWQKVEGL
ncbi:MAG: hypothetical protein FWH01_10425 [Oscillospiraceae bacterium]|nr:hypothetical protein [Oscillospiraceae bacterium]